MSHNGTADRRWEGIERPYSAEDVQLALRALRRDGLETLWRQVDSESTMKVALSEARPDAILSDFSMPGFDGMEALLLAREIVPQVPFIFLSFISRGMRFYLVAFLINRYGMRARAIIEERLEFWVTVAGIVVVAGIVAAVFLF